MFKTQAISFKEMGFSALWQEYQKWNIKTQPFFEYQPHNEEHLKQKAAIVRESYSTDRQQLVQALEHYYKRIGLDKNAIKSLKRLEDNQALTITTGQQLGLFGGPAFTLYKALSCVLLAKKASKHLNLDVIPIFWMADEDHDFEEIRKILTVHNSTTNEFEIKANNSASTVADIVLNKEIEQLLIELEDAHKTDTHCRSVLDQIKLFYSNGSTHLQAFGKLMAWMLTDLGVILIGSNDVAIKKLLKDPLAISVTHRSEIKRVLEKKSKELEKEGYPQQVQIGDSLLFRLNEKTGRNKLDYNPESELWSNEYDNARTFTNAELLNEIQSNPGSFSPNVFLRPILQDTLLPNIGYVAGPGELSYYAQTRELYSVFGLTMPIIYPRLSCTIIKSHIGRKINQLGWPLSTFKKRFEQQAKDLMESQYCKLEKHDFDRLEAKISEEIALFRDKVLVELPNQQVVYDRLEKIVNKEIKRLYNKYINQHKNNNSVELNRLRAVANSIFPRQQLQERVVSLVSLLLEYGMDFPQHLLAHIEETNAFGNHLIIEVAQPSTL